MLACSDATKDTPPTTAIPAGEEDGTSKRVYDLPIPSQKSLLDNYEHGDNNDEKYERVAQSTIHPRPLLPSVGQMIVPIGITTYPFLPRRQFLTAMNATTTTRTMKNTTMLREGTSWS